MKNLKLLRITTVPVSLKTLLKGQHRFMSEKGFEVVGVSSPGKQLGEVESLEGIRTVPLEMTRTVSPVKDLRSLWRFYRLCKKVKPTIVHSHTPKAGIVGMLGARLAGVPIRLHTVAGLPLMETSGVKRRVLDVVEKLTYRCATMVYPISMGLKDFIIAQRYTKSEKLKIIGNGSSNGFNSQYFDPMLFREENNVELRRSLQLGEDDFVFVFVGRLVGDKGINELIEGFKRCVSQDAWGRAVRLLLVGDFEHELDPLLSETLKEIEKNQHVHFVGYQQDVRPYLAISDALVFPSYREGFGNVVAQAGLMGLPSIVTDITGCNEIIVEGENGTIIPPKDALALEAAMRRFLEEPEYVAQLAKNARPMITSRYEQQIFWDALLEEYQRLLKEKGIEFTPCTKHTPNA